MQELKTLLTDEGQSVTTASDSKRGLALLKKNDYGTLVLDYKMTGYTGIDILKFIRGSDLKIRVFLLTGKPFIENMIKEENLSSFVNGIIAKPVDVNVFVRKLKVQKLFENT